MQELPKDEHYQRWNMVIVPTAAGAMPIETKFSYANVDTAIVVGDEVLDDLDVHDYDERTARVRGLVMRALKKPPGDWNAFSLGTTQSQVMWLLWYDDKLAEVSLNDPEQWPDEATITIALSATGKLRARLTQPERTRNLKAVGSTPARKLIH